MIDLHAQILGELQRILEIVIELTGLPSRWSGMIELVPDADFKGKKRFTCDIEINAATALLDERWSTLIHEVLHSVSAGYNFADFQKYRGWEEGTVEQLQRLLRADMLKRLGVFVAPEVFAANEKFHQFNRYIAVLEQLRIALDMDDTTKFYTGLLGVPIRDRSGYILELMRRSEGMFRMDLIKVFSTANAVLIGGTR